MLKYSLSVLSLCRYPNIVLMDATYKMCKLALSLFFLVIRTNVGYSVVAFHRLQAWLWWLVYTKNGVSNYQTYCMALLRVVGDAKMEDGYTKALIALQKSHVWLRFPNFRNYYTNQWAQKKKVKRSIVLPYCINISPGLEEELFIFVCLQMWVQAFRLGRQLYDNTNNGIEAQNKTFKYLFLNCCRNMSMLRLI